MGEGLLPDSDLRKRISELLPRLRPTDLFPNDANVARPPPSLKASQNERTQRKVSEAPELQKAKIPRLTSILSEKSGTMSVNTMHFTPIIRKCNIVGTALRLMKKSGRRR